MIAAPHYDSKWHPGRRCIEYLRFRSIQIGFAVVIALSLATSAQALVVGATPDVVPDTTVSPAEFGPSWTQGDPGWANVTHSGPTYVYLGDGWVLSARHVGVWSANFEAGSFAPIPGQDYVIRNPPPALVGGRTLTSESDLRLIRINGDPGLPSLTIASQAPVLGSEVLMIGDSRRRQSAETHWNVSVNSTNNPDGTPDWDWTETSGAGLHQGYKLSNPEAKRWGTNHLSNPANFDAFDSMLSGTTGIIGVSSRDTIVLVTSYDKNSPNPYESQGISGDSGGAVFLNAGTVPSPQWELAGIINAVLVHEDQPSGTAIYENATIFADLSRYFFPNQPNGELHPNDYIGSISDIIWSHKDYSLVGDLNLDGVLSGDGNGVPEDDDVASFIAGWGYDNKTGLGTITSWKNGDLNHDGKTDVTDFLMLRGALNGQISNSVAATLFGDESFDLGSIPEPSTSLLASLVAFGAFAVRRRPARI